eukprot:CAMPEP_0185185918 /NCGR_PEP_ID=MMETSP1140-20130426/3662_1 /TAXON_ID=298111 /ORGANISM="Pavlova sp., Strain CCMP459" /LENGTH=121 /DNA_ID=CAMNT_0027752155 /DNA_START=15 /DNA_END=380 /DNA_ORIENTATION=+
MAGFGRLIANIIIMGGGAVGRAFLDAYKQALQNGTTASSLRRAGGGITAQEARSILNVKPSAAPEEVKEAYQRLHNMNDPSKGGSAYLQAKIQNAHDALAEDVSSGPKAADGGSSAEAKAK